MDSPIVSLRRITCFCYNASVIDPGLKCDSTAVVYAPRRPWDPLDPTGVKRACGADSRTTVPRGRPVRIQHHGTGRRRHRRKRQNLRDVAIASKAVDKFVSFFGRYRIGDGQFCCDARPGGSSKNLAGPQGRPDAVLSLSGARGLKFACVGGASHEL